AVRPVRHSRTVTATERSGSTFSKRETTRRETTCRERRQAAESADRVALSRRQRRIAESARRFDAQSTQFVCECANATCTHRLEATIDEYETIRSDGATFMLAPGHAHEDIERVVEDRGRFQIVEKVQA